MRTSFLFSLIILFQSIIAQGQPALNYALAIHGGAGNIYAENTGPDQEKMYRDSLEKALFLGDSVLRNGGTSLDAVEMVIR